MMGIAANYADVWKTSYLSPDQFLLSREVFEMYLSFVKNNADDDITKNKDILKSIELDVLIAEKESELEYKKRIFSMERWPQVYYPLDVLHN